MKRIHILPILILLSSCTTEKRAVSYFSSHPDVAASFCGRWFPIKTETVKTVEFKEGKTDTLWSYEYIDCDTVIGETRVVKVPYPVQIKSRDTVFQKEVRIEEKTEYKDLYIKSTAKFEQLKQQRSKLVLGGILIGFIGAMVFGILLKKI